MTLIKCKQCGKPISDKARKCPNCERKKIEKEDTKALLSGVIIAFVIVFVIVAIISIIVMAL